MSQPTLVFAGSLGAVGIADEPRVPDQPTPNKGERSADRPNSKTQWDPSRPASQPGERTVRVR